MPKSIIPGEPEKLDRSVFAAQFNGRIFIKSVKIEHQDLGSFRQPSYDMQLDLSFQSVEAFQEFHNILQNSFPRYGVEKIENRETKYQKEKADKLDKLEESSEKLVNNLLK